MTAATAPRGDPAHEPEDPDDEAFAPVLEDGDARGRTTTRDDPAVSGTSGRRRSGTGVPDVASDHPDTLPTDEAGVRAAETTDSSRSGGADRDGADGE